MRSYSRLLLSSVATMVCSLLFTARADVVYNNTTNRLNQRYSSPSEFGDEIILEGPNRVLTNFTFEYFGTDFSGDEQARVRIYRNDGPTNAASANVLTPGSVLYDSGFFNISGAAANATLTLSGLALLVPDSFTWTILFSGLTGTEAAGLTLYSPPTVGNNYPDFWQNNGGTWELRNRVDRTAMDFGAIAEAAALSFRLRIQFIENTQIPHPTGPNLAVLSVDTVAGPSYTIESSTDLRTWATLSGPTTATGGTIVVTNEAPVGKRFYRARRTGL